MKKYTLIKLAAVLGAAVVGLGHTWAADADKPKPEQELGFSEQIKNAFDRDPSLISVEERADGMTIVDLNGSRQMVTVARIGPDGRVQTYCTSSQAEARAFLAGEDISSLGRGEPK